MAGEADLVADFHAVGNVPGVRGVRQDLAAQEGIDAAFVKQRYLLGIPQVGVRLVFDDGRLALNDGGTKTVEGAGLNSLVNLLDDGRRCLGALPVILEFLNLLGGVDPFRVDACDAQGRFRLLGVGPYVSISATWRIC